jgi:nitrite reductase/ring-hydroxylating ferredoxin subunit
LPASRREFIREISFAVAGVLASVGVTGRAAAQLPVTSIDAVSTTAHTQIYPLPAADGVQIDRKNEVILMRWQNAVYAFNLACPHQNVALRWNDKDQRFKCPKHNSRYQPDGSFIDGRATRGLDRFSISLNGATLTVDVDAMHKQDADPAGWASAVVRLS